jgi:hypothetical protein
VNVFISQGKGGTRSLCVWCSGCIVGLSEWGVSGGGGTGWFDFDRRKGQIGKLVYKIKTIGKLIYEQNLLAKLEYFHLVVVIAFKRENYPFKITIFNKYYIFINI